MNVKTKNLIIAGLLFSTSLASAANLYFTRGIKDDTPYNRNWENLSNWSYTNPSGGLNDDTSYNTNPATAIPTKNDNVLLSSFSAYSGPTADNKVKISTAVYAAMIKHSGGWCTTGITALNTSASINLYANTTNAFSGSGGGYYVIDNIQWDEVFDISANINIYSADVSGNSVIYNSTARSNGSTADADMKWMRFGDGYTINVLPNEAGTTNVLSFVNARSKVNGTTVCRTGDLIIDSKIVTASYVRLYYDTTTPVYDGYTPGVIRFTGSKSNEIGNINGFVLANGVVVELGMKDGAQFCDSNVQINNGSTLRLLASNQLDDKCTLQFKTPASSDTTYVGGTFEMNGFSERISGLTYYNDAATSLNGRIDFGVNDIAQVFHARTFNHTGGKMVLEGSHLYIKNYVLGEDHVYFDNQLNEVKKSMLVFEGYEGYVLTETLVYYDDGWDTIPVWEYSIQIPEPATFAALFGIGALALAIYRRRR